MKNLHLEPLGGGIEIYVSDSYHFSTDTILLADFSKQTGAKRCADLGTGCGTIPLLWLKNEPRLTVDAVEIQEQACALLQKSIAHNKLENRLTVHCADLKELKGRLPFGAYDLVACNPPYKLDGTGIKSPIGAKNIALHETQCTLDDICKAAKRLLRFGGRFVICQRPERLTDVLSALRENELEPKKLRFVQGRADKAPKLFLCEAKRGAKQGYMDVLPALIVEDENGFTAEMREIYGTYKDGHY